jgi:hypothetical protein
MSATGPSSLSQALSVIPPPLLTRLLKHYTVLKRSFLEGKFEPSELNGAKFAETVYRVLEWHTSPNGTFTPFGVRIRNFEQAVAMFGTLTSFPESVRFHIPRVLVLLYSIRNKRGVGHVGGDVDPNYMDAMIVVSGCDWVMAELVRMLHQLSPEAALALVQGLSVRRIPVVWDVGGGKRVLNVRLSFRDKMLVLLYSVYPAAIDVPSLVSWLEYSSASMFKPRILVPSHKQRLIEYDQASETIALSPLGATYVEKNIQLEL